MSLNDQIQALLDEAVERDIEGPIQVAAYLNGERIVDAWAAPEGTPIDGDTLLPMYSTGKGVMATTIHLLAERGLLDYDRPVAHYWPEFAANGKAEITLRQVLHHTAGMALMPPREAGIRGDDWDEICAFLAADSPSYPPGSRRQYHAISLSWLLGEPASRADGRHFSDIIRDEVLAPIGVAESLYFGLPEHVWPRCIGAIPPADPGPVEPAAPDARLAIPDYVQPLEAWVNDPTLRAACIPASNGFCSARALARHYAALVGPGVDGIRLLPDSRLDMATHWPPESDAIEGDGSWALGYGLQMDDRGGRFFGHGGYGGQIGSGDRQTGLAMAVLKARTGGPAPGKAVQAIRAAVGDG